MTWANRGMGLEMLLNYTNQVYLQKDLAVVNKRPTPVKIVKTKGTRVLSAFLEAPSTVDYEGVYLGHSLQFEAKSTKERTRFPLTNFHQHQIDHLRACRKSGAITFAIIEFASRNEAFWVPSGEIEKAWESAHHGGRKSIPYEEFEFGGWLIPHSRGVPLDYLAVIDQAVRQKEHV